MKFSTIINETAKDSDLSVMVGGIEKKGYDAYVIVNGAAKLFYKSSITLSNADWAIYSLSEYASPTITNLTDSTNFAFHAYDSAGNNSQTSYVGVYCRLPYTTIIAGQQILHIKGDLSLSMKSSYLAIGLARKWDYGISMQQLQAYYEWPNGLLAGNYPIDITITSGSTITSDGTDSLHNYFAIALESELHLKSNEASNSVGVSIPWASFTWIPTGDKFEYQS